MTKQSFLDAKEDELLTIANGCLNLAGSAAQVPKENIDDLTRLRLFLEAQLCLTEVIRKRADKAANRHFWIEFGLTLIIIGLIGSKIWEGRQQAALLKDMQANTAATALQIEKAAEATTASLEILRQERAEREKKPRLALYVGNAPIDKTTIRLAARPGNAQEVASIVLTVKNVGDAPLSTFRLHAHVPAEVSLNLETFMTVPQSELPPNPNTQRVTLQLPPLPAGETVRIGGGIYAPRGHSAFKSPSQRTRSSCKP